MEVCERCSSLLPSITSEETAGGDPMLSPAAPGAQAAWLWLVQWLGGKGGLQWWLDGEGGHHLEVSAGFATEKLAEATELHRRQN